MQREDKGNRERFFTTEANAYKFQQGGANYVDGVDLSEEESKYLLPHFNMLVVGKPGSGKSTTVRQLLMNKGMYYKKFDEIFIISPSFSKMDVKVKPGNHTQQFSLDWIYGKVDEVNRRQQIKTSSKLKQLNAATTAPLGQQTNGKYEPQAATFGANSKRFITPELLAQNQSLSMDKGPVIFSTRTQASSIMPISGNNKGQMKGAIAADKKAKMQKWELMTIVNNRISEQLGKLPKTQQKATHANVLFVFDDVINDIKKAEYDPRLAALFMNRRHLIVNCTISTMVITQKYTLAPTRIRSVCNWMILFKLSPAEFDRVYSDVVTLPRKTWDSILTFVFGAEEMLEGEGKPDRINDTLNQRVSTVPGKETMMQKIAKRRFDSLGIFVEWSIFYKNFQRIVLGDQGRDETETNF